MAEFFAQAFYDSACRDLLIGPIFMSRVPALTVVTHSAAVASSYGISQNGLALDQSALRSVE